MPTREEIAEQVSKKLGWKINGGGLVEFGDSQGGRTSPYPSEAKALWDALISSECEKEELQHKLAIAHDAIPHLTRECQRLREALRGLMKVVAEELTGPPKNVPKSHWAKQWDEAESALGASPELS